MHFVWDEKKNILNTQKHGMSFELAKRVFDDPYLLSWPDQHFEVYGEERWIGLGCIDCTLIVLVVHTYRSHSNGQEITRIISARKATKKEQAIYAKYRK